MVGSPISSEFLGDLRAHPNIGNVIVTNLEFNNDPIYAGMSLREAASSVPQLTYDMLSGDGAGHFYYAPANDVGATRRRELAAELKRLGLK